MNKLAVLEGRLVDSAGRPFTGKAYFVYECGTNNLYGIFDSSWIEYCIKITVFDETYRYEVVHEFAEGKLVSN